METAHLKQRIAQGENTTTEFKENFDQEAIETAAAFANTSGGSILIGVSEQLNERQRNALFHVEKNGQIATKEYVEINRVSRRVAYEELRDMTNKGLLSMIGKGRGSRYVRKLSD